jgi:adenylosuccinate lyase
MSLISQRYSSPEMRSIWAQEQKYLWERELWIQVMKAQKKAGHEISQDAIADYEKVKEHIDIASIDARELSLHHDVKARIEEFNSLAGHEYIHLGLTSRDVTDNVELHQIHQSLILLQRKVLSLLARLAESAERYADLPMVGRTHNVPAQVTTLGRKFATWAEELLFALQHLEELSIRLPLRGIRGAIGTSVDQINLLGFVPEEIDRELAAAWGFTHSLEAPSQIYPRSIDFEVVSTLAQLAAAPGTIATNIRLLSGFGLLAEGFAKGQVGSSAMPHKVNPRLSERVNSLNAILKGFVTMAAELTGQTWNEGDISCSAIRRVVLADSFHAIDGILDTTVSIIDWLEVFPDQISKELSEHLPILASTQVLMLATKKGVGRERAHEIIKGHAREDEAERRKSGSSTFFDRITADKELLISSQELADVLTSPLKLAGDAPNQSRAIARRIKNLPGFADALRYSPGIAR